MSENKRRKMELDAACSSASISTQEMSMTSVLDSSSEANIAQQTTGAIYRAGRGSPNKNTGKQIFNSGLSDFREAIKWTGFVDRSLLIKELLSETKETRFVMIFAPTRFGKSMNVDMVKCFVEIEKGRDVTNAPKDLKELENFKNYQAFSRYELGSPCKFLAEEDLVKTHFGRHPVLHINFKNVEVSSIEDVKYSVRELVHFAYRAHSYLKNGNIFTDSSSNEDANAHCRIWCDKEKYKKEKAIGGLQQLIQYLHAYHKRKVYLLVDEFDAPAVNAMLAGKSGDEVKNISNEVTALLGAVVKGEIADGHLLGSLITGGSYLGSVGISNHYKMNNVTHYNWLLDDKGRFAVYYGLSHNELTTILKHVFPNQDQKRDSTQKEVKALYNGYSFQGEPMYCLWSVLHYIYACSSKDALKITKTTFWGGSSIISKMGSLLKHNGIMKQMMTLMGDNDIFFSRCEKVHAQQLANFLNKGESGNSNMVFSFFMEQRYLTPIADQRENVRHHEKSIRVKIPNKDVLVAFQEMFKDYCLVICGLDDYEMTECANIFVALLRDRDDEIFKTILEDFYNHLGALLRTFTGENGVNEHSLQAALHTTMLKTGFTECCMEKYVTVGSETGKIDLWLFHDNFAVIFEMKFIESDNDESDNDDSLKKSEQQALEEILSSSKTKKVPYVKIFDQYPNIKDYLLIGISMNDKGEPYMCCLVNSLNDKDCIFFPDDH